jgi:DNA polymerase-3 subunit delta'
MGFARFSHQGQGIGLLQRSLERGRLSHAYLFTGANLNELEEIAHCLAKTLNCERSQSQPGAKLPSDCCEQCPSCRKIDAGNHPDVRSVRPESKSRIITIDQVRELMQTINLKPTQAEWKIAIIVAADRMNVQAANAFLKTLEEPPARSVLLLLTVAPEQILETVLSRCLRLSFANESGLVLDPACRGWLNDFAQMAVKGEQGLLGRYRLLGLLLTKLADIKGEIDKDLSARSPLERYDDVEPRLREKWEDELAAAVEAEYRHRRGDLLRGLQWWCRDLWLQALSLGAELLSLPELAEQGKIIAGRITLKEALRNLEVVEEMQRLLGSNVQEALALEVGLLKLKL